MGGSQEAKRDNRPRVVAAAFLQVRIGELIPFLRDVMNNDGRRDLSTPVALCPASSYACRPGGPAGPRQLQTDVQHTSRASPVKALRGVSRARWAGGPNGPAGRGGAGEWPHRPVQARPQAPLQAGRRRELTTPHPRRAPAFDASCGRLPPGARPPKPSLGVVGRLGSAESDFQRSGMLRWQRRSNEGV